MRITRHEIIKYLTDRPGQVVYRSDIAAATNFTENQVATAMLRTKRESPIGDDIQTIVAGNAWRYVPRQPGSSSDDRVAKTNKSRSLISLIREYFEQRPGQVISLTELIAFTGRTEAQVKVGVNNARSNHTTFKRHLQTIVSGNMWRYDGPARQPRSEPSPAPVVAVPAAPVPATHVVLRPAPQPASVDDDSTRLFEEVGTIDNQLVIRDSDGVLYRATPLT